MPLLTSTLCTHLCPLPSVPTSQDFHVKPDSCSDGGSSRQLGDALKKKKKKGYLENSTVVCCNGSPTPKCFLFLYTQSLKASSTCTS